MELIDTIFLKYKQRHKMHINERWHNKYSKRAKIKLYNSFWLLNTLSYSERTVNCLWSYKQSSECPYMASTILSKSRNHTMLLALKCLILCVKRLSEVSNNTYLPWNQKDPLSMGNKTNTVQPKGNSNSFPEYTLSSSLSSSRDIQGRDRLTRIHTSPTEKNCMSKWETLCRWGTSMMD